MDSSKLTVHEIVSYNKELSGPKTSLSQRLEDSDLDFLNLDASLKLSFPRQEEIEVSFLTEESVHWL